MASDLNVDTSWVPGVERGVKAFDQLATSVGKLAGTGKALEELRRIIVGVGDSGSALSQLDRSVKDLAGIVRGLPVELKSALGGIKTVGVDAGKALGEGVEQGAKESLTKAKDEALARINAIKDAVKVATENAQRSATGAYSTVGPRPVSVSPIIAKEVEAMNREAVALQSAVAKVMKAATLPGGVKSAEDSASVFYAAQDEQKAALAKWEAQLAKEAVAIESAVAKVMKAATFPGGSAKDSASVFYAAQDEQRAAMAKWEAQLAKEAVAVDSAVAKVMKAATLPGYTKSAQDSASVFYAAQDAERAAVVKWEAQLAKEAKQLEASVSKVIKAIERPGYTHAGPTWWEKALAEQEAAQIKLSAKNAELVAKIYANNTSGPIMNGTYSNLSNQQRVTPALSPRDVTPTVDAAKAAQGANSLNLMSSALARFTNNAGDAHSAARGLASGFGLLWLTWGNMLPLLAGAAISNSLVQIVKVGAEVGHSFETIRVLSQETGKDIQELEQTLLDLGQRGVYGPKEIAEAMKTMSLAGVSAKDITTSMKDVINLAVAGTTSLKASSDILTSLSAGFDIPAASYSHIADVLTKAAAVSKASIESMSEAFKRASAVHKLYGVSLEDLATELTLVNNLGIQGTAAGTAVLNMYADMQGRTRKVAEAMQKFGVDVKDANGNMKALVPMAMSVAQALDKMLPNKQNEFLRFITGERGARGMVPIIEAARTMSATSTEALTKLEEQQKKVQDNLAFAALSAAQMAMTPLNLMKEVGNSLETSLTKVFKSVERDVSVAAITMREAFASEGFVSALTTLATSIAHATVFVVEHLDTIAMVVKAYLVWKAAVISMAVFGAVEAGVISLTRALVAQRTATLASATAMEVLTAATATGGGAAIAANFARAIPVIGTIVSLALAGYAAWQLYASGTKSATEETDKFAKLTGGELLRVLGEEEAKLDRQLAQKREGLALDSAAIGVNLEKLKTENQSNEVALKQKILDQESKAARFAQTYGAKSGPTVTAQTELDALKKTYSEMYRLNRNLESDVTDTIARVKLKTLGLRVDTTPKAPAVSGLLDFDKFAKAAHAAKPSDFNYTKDLLTEANAAHSALMQELKREATEEKQIIDAKHKARLTSEAEYQSQSLMATIKEDRKQSDAIEQGWAERNRLISNAMNDIAKEAGGFEVVSEAAKKQGEAFAGLDPKMKALAEGYRKLMVDQGLSNTTFEKEVVTLKQVVAQREALLAIEFQGKIAAEAKAYKDLGRELDVSLQKQRDKLDLEYRMADMTEVQRAGLQAQLAYEEQSAQAIAKRTEALQGLIDTQSALADLIEGKVQNGFTLQDEGLKELIDKYGAASEAVKKYTVLLQEMKDKASNGASLAQHIAEVGQARKETIQLRDDLAKALTDAAMKGGQGFKNTWLSIRDWLKSTFAKTVLEPQLKLFFGQMLGTNAAGSAAGSAGGSAGGSAVGSLLGSSTGSIGTTLFGSPAAYGAAIGTTSVGAGSQAAMLAAQTADFGWAGVASTAASAGSAAGTLISALSNAVPYAAAVTAVAALFNKKSTPHVGGYASADETGKTTLVTKESAGAGDYMYQIMKDIQPETQTAVESLAKSFSTVLNNTAKTFKLGGAYQVSSAFAADNDDNSRGLLKILKNATQVGTVKGNFNSDPTKGLTEYTAASVKEVKRLLSEMDLPAWAKKQLDGLSDIGASLSDLATMSDNIDTIQLAFYDLQKTLAPMAGSLGELSTASSDTLYNLSVLAGGFGNLSAILSTYYKNYYSQEEQHKAGMSSLATEYAKLNVGALPQTKEAFRGVIDSFVAGGGRLKEGGEQTYLTMMQLANTFSDLNSEAVDLTKQHELEVAILRAQGNEMGAVAIERQLELAALQKTNPELVTLQKALYDLADAADFATKLESAKAGLDGVAGKFLAGPDLYSYKASRIQDTLKTGGVNVDTDQILGATRDDIAALWKSVGLEGKIAITEAYQAWEDLQTLVQQTKMDDFLRGLNTTGDELMGAYDKINPKAKNLVQAWEDTTTKIDDLRSSLNSLLDLHMGETPLETALRKLKDLITRRDDLQGVVKGNEDTIYGLKSSQVSQKGVDYLKNLEKNLWASYKASDGDPKIAAQLTKVTLDRIKLEGQVKDAAASDAAKLNEKNVQAQKDALQAQIDGYKKLKDMAKELQTYILSLKAGDLSNQSYAGRLNTSKGIFDTSIKGAMSGDATALGAVQGNAQDYLKQAQQFYGGSTKEYSDIFNAVTSSLESVIGAGAGADPMLAAAQAQLDALNNLGTTTTDTSDAQIAALEELNATFGVDVASMSASIDAQSKVLKDQLTALENLATQQAAIITQAGEAYTAMVTDLDEIAADLRGTRRTAELEAASV